MTTFAGAAGHDVADVSLTEFDPQPDDEHGGGIEYADVIYGGDRTVTPRGPFFPFVWKELTAAQFATILSTLGVASADNANVTIRVRDVNLSTWVRKNGVAQRPFPGREVKWKNRPVALLIMVTDLETAA